MASQLKKALSNAQQELASEVRSVFSARQETIRQRVMAVLQPDQSFDGFVVLDLLEQDSRLSEVRRLEPSSFLDDSDEGLLGTTKRLLDGFTAVDALAREEI